MVTIKDLLGCKCLVFILYVVFFMQMSEADTDADIEAVLDKLESVACHWLPTQPITPVKKASLLQELVYEEIVDRRHKQIVGLRKGLQQLNIMDVLNATLTS